MAQLLRADPLALPLQSSRFPGEFKYIFLTWRPPLSPGTHPPHPSTHPSALGTLDISSISARHWSLHNAEPPVNCLIHCAGTFSNGIPGQQTCWIHTFFCSLYYVDSNVVPPCFFPLLTFLPLPSPTPKVLPLKEKKRKNPHTFLHLYFDINNCYW